MYQVSNYGKVKSLTRIVYSDKRGAQHIKEKTLKPYLQNGYPTVYLCKNGIAKDAFVHVLVARSFIPNTYNKPQVNHKDSNRSNNHWNNLEWVTQAENLEHARKKGRMFIPTAPIGENQHSAKLTSNSVREIREKAKNMKYGKYAKLAREYGVSAVLISGIVRLKNWKHIK